MADVRNRRAIWLPIGLWAGFAVLVIVGGYAMLRACDLGFFSLFGYASCAAPPPDRALAAEQERQTNLRAGIHSAEMRLAQLPFCPKPQPVAPKSEPEKPDPKNVLVLPKKVTELKGCWQSADGDIEVTSDDAAKKSIGKMRLCYCFGNDGNGTVRAHFDNGNYCQAPLTAKVGPDRVFMHHDVVPCNKGGQNVGADIVCSNDQSNHAVCEIQNLGVLHTKWSEHFIRVTEDYCLGKS